MSRAKVEELFPEFVDEAIRQTPEQLEHRIVEMQKGLEESEAHKEANEALKQARSEVNTLSGPYRDVKKAVKLKTSYILELLKEKGK